MKAVKYKVKISIDAVHSWGDRLIEEIYIPEVGAIINDQGFAFKSDEARGIIEIKDIEVDEEIASFLKEYVVAEDAIKKVAKELF